MDEQPGGPRPGATEEPTPTPVRTSGIPAIAGDVLGAARRHWRGGLRVVAVATLSCAVVVVVSHHAGNEERGIRVVETGFSVLSDSDYDVSYGVVIENTTDQVAYHTVACVTLHGDANENSDDNEDSGCRRFTVEVLLPGQQVGFGALDNIYTYQGTLTDVSVELQGPATWEDPDEPGRAEIVASDLDVAYSPDNHPVVSFDRQSHYEHDVARNASVYAVLRNTDGEIVGASGIDLDVPVRPQETVRHSIVHEAPIPDLATAEVYIFPSGI
jgi:hypothetical protein